MNSDDKNSNIKSFEAFLKWVIAYKKHPENTWKEIARHIQFAANLAMKNIKVPALDTERDRALAALNNCDHEPFGQITKYSAYKFVNAHYDVLIATLSAPVKKIEHECKSVHGDNKL